MNNANIHVQITEAGGFYVHSHMALFNMEMKMVNDFMLEFIVIWELGEISAYRFAILHIGEK